MNWKIYSLGNSNDLNSLVTNKLIPKLNALGYETAWTSSDAVSGNFSITVNDVVYTSILSNDNSKTIPYYLCINDATNDILITSNNPGVNGTTQLKTMVNWALISGINMETGEPGLFRINDTGWNSVYMTNVWYTSADEFPYMMLHRAIFTYIKLETNNYVPVPFVSNLFWGRKKLSVGATVAIGDDNFVCLGGYLYAKL